MDNFIGEEVIISVYNSQGQKVKEVIKAKENTEGYYQLKLDLSTLSKGTYIVNVQSDNHNETKQVVLY